ncbi:MAG: rhomboid family intramembrane serine protease [Gammaproteobacteria bacterium]
MFPLFDDNPRLGWPLVTALLIVLNALAWVFLQGMGFDQRALAGSFCHFGLIPADLLGIAPEGTRVHLGSTLYCVIDGVPGWLSVFSSMFMHGGWMHIVGNLWFLWVFCDNVEDAMGPLRFTLFYLLGGVAAAAAQVLSDPASTVPMVGASGAIGAVMGAYAVLYPRARVQTLIFLGIWITRVPVPAFVMLGYWFLLQLLGGLPALGGQGGGVAFWAHIGGFVAGLVLAPLMRSRARIERLQSLRATDWRERSF